MAELENNKLEPEPIPTLEGFDASEIVSLTWLRNHYYEQTEQLEIDADNNRLRFVRWLVEQGRLSDW